MTWRLASSMQQTWLLLCLAPLLVSANLSIVQGEHQQRNMQIECRHRRISQALCAQ